jgi:hypothetical protein
MSILNFIAGFIPSLVDRALATAPPIFCAGGVPCPGIPNPATYIANTAGTVYEILTTVVGAIAVAALVWAGFQFVLANGDESKVTKGRQGAVAAIAGVALVVAASSIVFTLKQAISGTGVLTPMFPATVVGTLTNILLMMFNGAMVIVIILAGIRMATAAGKQDQFQKATNAIKWALIGGVVANMSKAFLELLLKYLAAT